MSAATERAISPASPWESSVGPAAEALPADGEAGTPTKKVRRTVTLVDQSQTALSGKKLVIVIVSLAAIIFLASFQQVSVSTTLPGIAKDFGTSTAISWVGTAFLVAKYNHVLISWLIRTVRQRKFYIRGCRIYLDGKRF
jgi:hypothetical protein